MVQGELWWRTAQHDILCGGARAAVCSHLVREYRTLRINALVCQVFINIATEHSFDRKGEAFHVDIALRVEICCELTVHRETWRTFW